MELLMFMAGLLLAAFGILALLLVRKERREMERLIQQAEHFLIYAEQPLPETLDEGVLANLNNQLSRLEQLLVHQRRQGKLREDQTTRFVENMAHQMKNALTALQLQLDLLSLHLSPDAQTSLEKSQACMERLTGEIDRILKSSQLAAGKIKMTFEPLELREELAACTERLAPLAAAKQVSFAVDGPEREELSADSFWFSQALENLLKNAVEHTAEQTVIRVRITEEGRLLRLRIEDEGEGIPPEELPGLFTRFTRGRAKKAGYGIGLSMAKDIVEAHHGTLTAGNRPGRGAWFEIVQPVLDGVRLYQ